MTISPRTWMRSQAEDARFRTIFEQSPVSTQIFSPEGETIAVNRSWEKLWGVTLDRITGYNVLKDPQLVTKGIMPYIVRGFSGEAVSIPPVKYEPDATIPDISQVPYRWVRAWIYPVKNQDGTIREVVLMHEDITEQMQAQEALRGSEERFRVMFDGAPVGLSLLDRDGHYVAVNAARQEMLGYSEEELMGRHYLEVTHPDDVTYDHQINAEANADGRTHYQLEKRFVRKDGSVRWTRITVSMVRDGSGEPLYSVSIAEDITERKQLEEERTRLLEAERAAHARVQQLSADKDYFLSAAAHDLRTPLTTVKGRVQMLRQRAERGILQPDRLLDDLARIEAGTTRMVRLINELLDIANIQIGRPLNLVRQPVDLVELARDVLAESQQSTARHRIVLETDQQELEGVWDAARLERVLANLLSNAVKYSPDGGTIRVSVHLDRDDAHRAVLAVRDEGIGIPSDDLPHIFERFHRGANTAGKISGTGIGLSAVRAILEQHGGRISVASKEGAGSTFIVSLPLTPPPVEAS